MKIAKLNISWARYSDAELETKARHILDSMTGNTNFPNPVPTLLELKAAVEKFSTDLAASKTRTLMLVAEKNKSRKQLEVMLTQLGQYIMSEVYNDRPVLLSTGFSLWKDAEPGYITSPGNVTLSNGLNPGEIAVSVQKPKAAISFLYELTGELAGDNTIWVSTAATIRKNVFSNLQSGKQYSIRVAAVGSKGQIVYSSVFSIFAQ